MMHKEILLVEDNPDDVELTRLAFDEAKIANPSPWPPPSSGPCRRWNGWNSL